MEDVANVEQDGKASSESGGAVEESGELEDDHEQQGSAEISGEGNPEHEVAAGMSYVVDLSVGTLVEDDPSMFHKSRKEVTQSHEAGVRELPENLQDLFDRPKETLPPEQAAWMKKVLLEFVDVLMKTDLDIGQFTALAHCPKTG